MHIIKKFKNIISVLKLKDTFIITYNEDTKVVNLAVKDMEEKGYKKISITPVSQKAEFPSSTIEYIIEYQKIK